MTLDFFLNNAWRWKVGMPEKEWLLDTKNIEETEWNEQFIQYMKNRLIMGSLRYGRLNAPGKPKYDRVASIIRRAKLYEETGNQETLVDIANECLCEFTEPNHPNYHFEAADNTNVHTEIKK